jgi:hypothetical protein
MRSEFPEKPIGEWSKGVDHSEVVLLRSIQSIVGKTASSSVGYLSSFISEVGSSLTAVPSIWDWNRLGNVACSESIGRISSGRSQSSKVPMLHATGAMRRVVSRQCRQRDEWLSTDPVFVIRDRILASRASQIRSGGFPQSALTNAIILHSILDQTEQAGADDLPVETGDARGSLQRRRHPGRLAQRDQLRSAAWRL